jgi:uncharacterized protein (TIGR02246 family)
VVDRDEAERLFNKRVEAWLSEDIDAYMDMFAEDLLMQTPSGEPLRGRSAYGELVRRSLQHVRPVSFEVHEIAVQGSKVLAEWTQTHELRASGRRLRYRGMSVCEMRDGLIRSWREYYDPADLQPS